MITPPIQRTKLYENFSSSSERPYINRDSQLDILKGIGILLVVFAHICRGNVTRYIYLFHMPLFFFLSGAALNYSKEISFNFGKRFKQVIMPYLTFSILCFLYWVLIEIRLRPVHDGDLFTGLVSTLEFRWQQFINIFVAFSFDNAFLYNIVLWFLPCLFVAMILYVAIRKYMRNYAYVGIAIVTILGVLMAKTYLPLCTEIAFVVIPFIYLGESFYKKTQISSPIMGGVFLLSSISLIMFFNPHVDMRTHSYGSWWLFYAVAILLIFSLCTFSRYIVGRDLGILEWLGRNSLAIMCIHEPIKRILLVGVSKLTGMETFVLRESITISLGITFLLILLLIPVIIGINKYSPWMVGKNIRQRTIITQIC